jgi:DNA-binding NarL/FixJ family response regulator
LLLADDHPVLMAGIRKLLEEDYEIVGTAENGRDLVAAAVRLRPDAIVMDVGMPLLNGIEAARQMRRKACGAKLVFLTQQSSQAYIREAFRSGGNAYVLKQAAASELLTAIDEALHNRYYISPMAATQDVMTIFNPKVNPGELFGGALTARQREVLQLMAEGKSAKEIGSILGISVKTVEFHKAAIMDELGLRTTAELTRYAIECGIVV